MQALDPSGLATAIRGTCHVAACSSGLDFAVVVATAEADMAVAAISFALVADMARRREHRLGAGPTVPDMIVTATASGVTAMAATAATVSTEMAVAAWAGAARGSPTRRPLGMRHPLLPPEAAPPAINPEAAAAASRREATG